MSRRPDVVRRRGPLRVLAGIVAVLALAACAPAPVKKPVEAPTAPLRTVAGAAHYRVTGNGTLVYARVFRAGSLSKLGHNHVVEFADVRGDIFLAGDPGNSLFDINVAPAAAIVDAPGLRQRQGGDFDSTVSDSARAGTRRNMLGKDVLDAAKYPYVRISSSKIEGSFENPRVTVDLTLRGVTRTMTIPVSMHVDVGHLVAEGRFALHQSDFGIQPYSVLGGALKVKDKVEVVFTIAADQIPGH